MELRFSPSEKTIVNRFLSRVHLRLWGVRRVAPKISRFNTDYSTRYSPVKRSWKQVSRNWLVRLADSMTEQRQAEREQNVGVSRRVAERRVDGAEGSPNARNREGETRRNSAWVEKSRTIPQSFGPLPSSWLAFYEPDAMRCTGKTPWYT